MTESPLRAGVVGAGSMGRNHVRVYREHADVDLVGVADRDEVAARRVADAFRTRARSTEQLLADVDLVSVAVPTPAHADVVRNALDAGVHVLVEKPFVTDLDAGRELAALADRRDLVLQVGHVERFNPAVRTLFEIAEGLDVIAVDAHRLGPPVDREQRSPVPLDLMIHDIDVVRALLGDEPHSLSAAGTADGQYATACAEFDGGTVASLTASRLTQQKVRRLGVTARECRVIVDYTDQSVEIHRGAAPEYVADGTGIRHRTESVVERPVVETGEPLRAELDAFVEAARTGSEPLVTAEDGLRAVSLARRVEDRIAAANREEVSL